MTVWNWQWKPQTCCHSKKGCACLKHAHRTNRMRQTVQITPAKRCLCLALLICGRAPSCQKKHFVQLENSSKTQCTRTIRIQFKRLWVEPRRRQEKSGSVLSDNKLLPHVEIFEKTWSEFNVVVRLLHISSQCHHSLQKGSSPGNYFAGKI